jgi:hypothetical protein
MRLEASSKRLVARRITGLRARVIRFGFGCQRRSPAPFSFAARLTPDAATLSVVNGGETA